MRLNVRFTVQGKVKTLRFSEDERNKAMDAFDTAMDAALPGQTVELVNADNDRVVSQYTNFKVAK